ncbi:MAG: type II toxin-antitoxin system RelE/ParE family toxin [Nitrospirae bacterium]|nr:type II toxin-antitoxin system RelE/ParE family toxin [Nitrospirota bacterium]
MKIIASNHFLKFKKKSPARLQVEIDKKVKEILQNPEIGELKRGDLKGIRVYKFKHETQLLLMSYEYSENALYLYTIGSHENFYKKLKEYL